MRNSDTGETPTSSSYFQASDIYSRLQQWYRAILARDESLCQELAGEFLKQFPEAQMAGELLGQIIDRDKLLAEIAWALTNNLDQIYEAVYGTASQGTLRIWGYTESEYLAVTTQISLTAEFKLQHKSVQSVYAGDKIGGWYQILQDFTRRWNLDVDGRGDISLVRDILAASNTST